MVNRKQFVIIISKMKKLGGVLAILALTIALVPPGPAAAAACANISTFGAVNLTIPDLTKTQKQALWIRMQAPAADSKVLVEINGSECLEVGGQNMKSDAWTWQTWRNNGQVSVVNFKNPSGNFIKIIGVNDGVKIDRILMTDAACTPEDYGNNCRDAVELHQSEASITTLPAPSEGTVSGKVLLTNTPEQNSASLKSVEYIVKGRVVQTSDSPKPFDTTLIKNGKYEVQIITTLDNGEVITEATVIDVKNPENAFTPVMRWVRLNERIVKIAGLVIAGILATALLLVLFKKFYLTRRERRFHGF